MLVGADGVSRSPSGKVPPAARVPAAAPCRSTYANAGVGEDMPQLGLPVLGIHGHHRPPRVCRGEPPGNPRRFRERVRRARPVAGSNAAAKVSAIDAGRLITCLRQAPCISAGANDHLPRINSRTAASRTWEPRRENCGPTNTSKTTASRLGTGRVGLCYVSASTVAPRGPIRHSTRICAPGIYSPLTSGGSSPTSAGTG